MNKDIRIDLSFSNHRKRKKLLSLLGPQGVLSLIDLWLKVAESRPKGILTGMDESDIALDAQWSGDPKEFCKVLLDVGFLDQNGDRIYSIHDWKDHQPFAYYADERSEKSRELAFKRWGKKSGIESKGKDDNADGMRGACVAHAEGNAPIPSPIPSPIPIPKPKKELYGPNSNIRLTSEERAKLDEKFGPQKVQEFIDTLSFSIASRGDKYKSHYMTILYWHRQGWFKPKEDRPL